MAEITATEASRSFSEVLNRVAGGERLQITRSGAPVAEIGPPPVRSMSAARFRGLIEDAPRPDSDYGEDVRAAREQLGAPRDPWASS